MRLRRRTATALDDPGRYTEGDDRAAEERRHGPAIQRFSLIHSGLTRSGGGHWLISATPVYRMKPG
jgi:hypothetical protein